MKTIENIKIKIKKWCEGKYIPPPEEPISSLTYGLGGRVKKPFIVTICQQLWNFWKKEWKILLPVIVAAVVALYIHFDSKPTRKTEQEKNKTVSEGHVVNHPTFNKK